MDSLWLNLFHTRSKATAGKTCSPMLKPSLLTRTNISIYSIYGYYPCVMAPSKVLTLAGITVFHKSPAHLSRHMWSLMNSKNRVEIEIHNGKHTKYKSDHPRLQLSHLNSPLRQIHVLTSFRQAYSMSWLLITDPGGSLWRHSHSVHLALIANTSDTLRRILVEQ